MFFNCFLTGKETDGTYLAHSHWVTKVTVLTNPVFLLQSLYFSPMPCDSWCFQNLLQELVNPWEKKKEKKEKHNVVKLEGRDLSLWWSKPPKIMVLWQMTINIGTHRREKEKLSKVSQVSTWKWTRQANFEGISKHERRDWNRMSFSIFASLAWWTFCSHNVMQGD